MSKNLEDFFKQHKGEFDTQEPRIGHFERFQAKLGQASTEDTSADEASGSAKDSGAGQSWKTYFMAVAAAVILMFGYWLGNYNNTSGENNPGLDLADVSPKMQETQNFYLATIQKEIEQIDKKRNASNQKIIDDAFKQLETLEANYLKLTLELKESNADKRVIYAMISNFQSRMLVLQNLMEQLEEFERMEQMTPQENQV